MIGPKSLSAVSRICPWLKKVTFPSDARTHSGDIGEKNCRVNAAMGTERLPFVATNIVHEGVTSARNGDNHASTERMEAI